MVVPGTYQLTRRVRDRQFLLTPDEVLNEAVEFIVAEAGTQFGVLLHQVVVMSNHVHMVVTFLDPDSMPTFAQRLHRHLACFGNAHRKRRGGFWDESHDYAVFLDTPERILKAMVYCAANPSKADLVDDPRDWPGLWTGPEHIGKRLDAVRPTLYFRPDLQPSDKGGPASAAAAAARRLSARATLAIVKPPGFDHQTDAEFAADFASLLAEETATHRARRAATGKRVLGRQRILRQDSKGMPTTTEARFQRRPRFATSSPERHAELVAQERLFAQGYSDARRRFHEGDREVLFPWGTYGPRVFYGALCSDPPDTPAPITAAA